MKVFSLNLFRVSVTNCFVCLFFQVDAVTILLSNILPVPCSHNSVKTKAVVEIFPLFFD